MSRNPFAHSTSAAKGLFGFAKKLTADGVVDENDALRISATEMDGAGDGATVDSTQTCLDLEMRPVAGLTGSDGNEAREDPYVRDQVARHEAAEAGVDEAAVWLAEHDHDPRRRR